jgi:L-seryl-tRNA(Ser) seleniumtransferase
MNLRGLASVEQLLQTKMAVELIAEHGRPLTVEAIRTVLADVRSHASTSEPITLPNQADLLTQTAILLEKWVSPTLLPIINASGVILHTNLGRAPLSSFALQAMEKVAQGYSNLELDLETGRRGSRLIHTERLLQRLTGAGSALLVNNNAAAILLVLAALANRRRVIISRSQLIEIGGGFRVTDVMKQSGAKLVEVGTTNKVHLADYEEALTEPAALVMHAHHSNFKMVGFTEEPDWKDIASLAHRYAVPCLDDLGSGALMDTSRFGLPHEPTVQESLAAGSDLVCFSGDKLLGGPQSGIIVGQAGLISKISKHPLYRAVRTDKLCQVALTATLQHYLKDEAVRQIPVWRMIALTPDQLRQTAEGWVQILGQGEVIAGKSTIGGGSLPEEHLDTFLLALDVKSPNKFLDELRRQTPPIIARTENNRVLLDPRTVPPEEDTALLNGLMNVLQEKLPRPGSQIM